MKFITPAELKTWIDKGLDIQLIDIREQAAYDFGHLPAAIHIEKSMFADSHHLVSRDRKVVIYCSYGMKSDQVALFLQEKHNLRNIWILEGGLYDYVRDVDPGIPFL